MNTGFKTFPGIAEESTTWLVIPCVCKKRCSRRAARRSSFPFLKTWRSLLVDALRYPASSGGAARRLDAR